MGVWHPRKASLEHLALKGQRHLSARAPTGLRKQGLPLLEGVHTRVHVPWDPRQSSDSIGAELNLPVGFESLLEAGIGCGHCGARTLVAEAQGIFLSVSSPGGHRLVRDLRSQPSNLQALVLQASNRLGTQPQRQPTHTMPKAV